MAHDLSIRASGFTEMAYVGEKPWHGLGQELAPNATIEAWAAAAGMDWKVLRAMVRYPVSAEGAATNEFLTDPSKHVLFRSDSHASLAIVSDKFNIVQPRATLEFFRDLTESAGFHLCTAGVLKGGQKFWAQAEAGLRDNVLGNDVIDGKLLLATACDGSMQTIVKAVSERVVCANTLAMAMGEKSGKLIKVSHRSVFDPATVKAQLGIAVTNFESFISQARTLARAEVSPAQADAFLLGLLYPTQPLLAAGDKDQLLAARAGAGYAKINSLFNGAGKGAQLDGNVGTAWGLLNSCTEYVDHHRGTSKTTRDNRMDYAWFGDGDKLKSQAFAQLMSLVS